MGFRGSRVQIPPSRYKRRASSRRLSSALASLVGPGRLHHHREHHPLLPEVLPHLELESSRAERPKGEVGRLAGGHRHKRGSFHTQRYRKVGTVLRERGPPERIELAAEAERNGIIGLDAHDAEAV